MSILTDMQSHLTSPNQHVTAAASLSFPGMAHFAKTGPLGASCRDCCYWEDDAPENNSQANTHRTKANQACCAKYRQLTGHLGKKVPGDAAACRHFERR